MRPLLAISILLAPTLAHAHDFWVQPEAAGFVLRDGHHGGELLPIDRARLRSLRCGGAKAVDLLPAAVFTGTEVRTTGKCSVVSASYYEGFFSLTPDGEVPLPRSKAHDVVKSWESKLFAKWVDAKAPDAQRPCGDELELVPVLQQRSLRAGDELAVRVLFRGAPVAGATLEARDRPVGETNGAGEARIKLPAAGIHTVEASVRHKLGTADADDLVIEASLSFEVQP